MAKLFQIKFKIFQPNNPNIRYSPSIITSLAGANTKAKAIEMATNDARSWVRKSFQEADVKMTACKPINFDRFVKQNERSKGEN